MDKIVKNKFFALGVASNLLTEWGRKTLIPPDEPIIPEIPEYDPPIPSDDIYCWRPHVYSWWSTSSVTVPIINTKGEKDYRSIEYDYVNTRAGGVGGSGFKPLEDGAVGDFGYDCGEGGQYGMANDGGTFVSDILKKYQVDVPASYIAEAKEKGEKTDAKCVILNSITGEYNIFVPRYFWGSGTKVQLKPNMYLYLIGGDGEDIDKTEKYFTCSYTSSGEGDAIGFFFDDSIKDTGLEWVEIVNNQTSTMSTSSHNIRIFDGDYDYSLRINYGKGLCEGGRSCTMNVKGVNYNKMYACAGGGGGAGISMNDASARARDIVNAYKKSQDTFYNTGLFTVNRLNFASIRSSNLKGYRFSKGAMGVQMSIDICGELASNQKIVRTVDYFSDFDFEFLINIGVELYSGEKYSVSLTKGVETGGRSNIYASVDVDLNYEFKRFQLDKNSEIKFVEVRLNSTVDTIINTGGLMVNLINQYDEEMVEQSNSGTPTVSFQTSETGIGFLDFLYIEPPQYDIRDLSVQDGLTFEDFLHIEKPQHGVKYLSVQDGLTFATELDCYGIKAPKPNTPEDDFNVSEILQIEKG